jgi:tight adherence protein B
MAMVIIALLLLFVLLLGGVAYFFVLPGSRAPQGGLPEENRNQSGFGGSSAARPAMSENFSTQKRKPQSSVFGSASTTAAATKRVDSRLTLRKRLKYAQWTIPPVTFRVAELAISLFAMSLAAVKLNIVMVLVAGVTGPLVMNAILNWAVDRRFKAFDMDYPAFLLSVVGLLKTGMNAMSALEASAQGLPEASMLRQEVEMMIERLRFGVPEDKSIGAFGEDVYHPEIELFVQALLLSRRVGGTLSDTLERLSKQVRKRQYFRASAVAAVGRSIWFIIAILTGLEIYLYIVYPSAVIGAWNDPVGWNIWQTGILLILIGIFWVRQVTKLKI